MNVRVNEILICFAPVPAVPITTSYFVFVYYLFHSFVCLVCFAVHIGLLVSLLHRCRVATKLGIQRLGNIIVRYESCPSLLSLSSSVVNRVIEWIFLQFSHRTHTETHKWKPDRFV